MTGEFAAIEVIRSLLPRPTSDGEIWIGDDSAVVPSPDGGVLLLAADSVVGGVHADLSLTTVADLGWKALVSCLSDIAAMGGDPRWALVTVAGPAGTRIDSLYSGIAEAAEEFGCPVVGGDLSSAPALVVTVAVTGHCAGTPVLRSGARPGDEVWATGALGGSAAGLRALRAGGDPAGGLARRHARPVPRLAEGRAARKAGATAMIDVSDGLAADLGHVAAASGVGISLDLVPVAEGATDEEALSGGEDYELAFCAPSGDRLDEAFGSLRPPVKIGECTAGHGGVRLAGSELEVSGWEHRF